MKSGGTSSPIASQPVAFQKKKGKSWKTFKTVTTSSTGVAKVKFKVKRKTTIRAYFAGAGEISSAALDRPSRPRRRRRFASADDQQQHEGRRHPAPPFVRSVAPSG